MEHGGDEGDEEGITVELGDTGKLTYTFREGDELLTGCRQEGRSEAGMTVTVRTG